MRVLSVDGRRAKRAREYLAVQLGIVQYVALAAIIAVSEALPGTSHSLRPLGYSCAGLALAYAALQWSLPARRSLMWLFWFGNAAYIALASGAIAASGGASSPVRVMLLFSLVYGSWFYETVPALVILGLTMLATLLPLTYDSHAFSSHPLGLTVALSAVLIVGTIGTIKGRAELTRLRDAARRDARRDPLTGLANRRALIRELGKLCSGQRSGDRFGLVFLDLDGFKEINTEFGHAGGDAVLTAVGEALREAARDEDLVARIGGDEFAVLARGAVGEALVSLAERLVTCVDQALCGDFLPHTDDVQLGASAGVAIWPDDATDPDSLLRSADLALMAAKRAGKGRVLTSRHDSGLLVSEKVSA